MWSLPQLACSYHLFPIQSIKFVCAQSAKCSEKSKGSQARQFECGAMRWLCAVRFRTERGLNMHQLEILCCRMLVVVISISWLSGWVMFRWDILTCISLPSCRICTNILTAYCEHILFTVDVGAKDRTWASMDFQVNWMVCRILRQGSRSRNSWSHSPRCSFQYVLWWRCPL